MAEHSSDDVEAPPITRKSLMTTNLPKMLNLEEKKYLLAIERSDMSNIKRMLQIAHRKKHFDINCVDSLGRGALTISIDQENLEMVELLIIMGVETRDALLHAINVEFVEAVELLLEHEELIHKEGELYSWQKVDHNTACFTPDITPLVLAAHRNNYEILKILLDRGATVPMPHDIKCGCEECIKQSAEDSLRHSLSRLNEYKALASPSLIALSSSDPILTAFQLSWELRNLAFAEPECKSEYMDLRRQCQQFAVDLLHQSRSSHELAIILNHDPQSPAYVEGEHMKLTRLELAIQYKQKKFVAHPNIQQLLAAIWYEGVPGFRRKSSMLKFVITIKVALLFPFYSMLYILAPETRTGKLMRKPFMKFLIHASSYLFFLLILILVSQRAEDAIIENFGTESMRKYIEEKNQRQRGNAPMILEYVVLIYVIGFIFEETHEIYIEGIQSYLRNMWNFIDFTRNSLYTAVIVLRMAAYVQQRSEIMEDPLTAYIRREEWAAFDFQLVAEGLFAAANIFSALKLVHLFSINPHLGPLQISLGRMVIDIVKFFFIYSLVLFAFACGLNQLLWYFSDLEKKKCYHFSNGTADFDNFGDSCMKWRNFANVFETSQSLFWASFGLVDLSSFELTGIKTYTRFWGLLMFGSYSVINVIVLLNLLIAMMSNSYAIIDEHSDTEWKFARTKLWMSYFEESATLPPPFNIFPTPKFFFKLLGLRKKDKMRKMSTKRRNREEKERDYKYSAVMRALVWRYVAAMHRKEEENPVTEDDINELKSDISSFRYEMMDVLHKNGMNVSASERKEKAILGKKNKIWERRLMKDFKVGPVATEEEEDLLFAPPPENEHPTAKFRRIARMAIMNTGLNKWRQVIKGACIASQIGHCHSRDSFTKLQNLQKAMHEAKKFSNKTPVPSRSVTPIHLPDTTGSNIMDIIRDFKNEDKDGSSSFIASPSPDNKLFAQKPNSVPMDVLFLAGETPDLINLESQKNTPRKCTSPPSFKYILGEDDTYKKMSPQKYIRAPQPQYPDSKLCRSDETQIPNSEVRMGSREIIEEHPSSSEDVLNTLSESQSNDDAYVDMKDPAEQDSISADSSSTEDENEILHESKDTTLLETNDEGLDKALAVDKLGRNQCISPELKITGADGEDIPLKSPSKVAKPSNVNARSEIEKYEVLIHKNIEGTHVKQEAKQTSMPSMSSVGEDVKSEPSITNSKMPNSTSSLKAKSVASGSDVKQESAAHDTALPIQSLDKEMKLGTDIAIASPTKTISDETKPEALVSSAALSVHSMEIPISGSKNVTQEKSPMASRNISRIHDKKRIQRKTGWL